MRKQEEMINLILNVAKEDNRIKAVYMGGSRVDPTVERDAFQDYDIVYVVDVIKPFLECPTWIDVFGNRLLLQTPNLLDEIVGWEVDNDEYFPYLMLFEDGNRIDLTLKTVKAAQEELDQDPMNMILMDKENILIKNSEVSNENHWIKEPTVDLYRRCTNQFWWISQNAVKAIKRGNVIFAQEIIDLYLRECLMDMISWNIGYEKGFNFSLGKGYSKLQTYISKDIWNDLVDTYSKPIEDQQWQSLFIMAKLFSDFSKAVACSMKIEYYQDEEENGLLYMRVVKSMDKDADDIDLGGF